jgi:murein DD-endopeptidase MepM/ murein hydrolase activator NlpD
MPTFTLFRSEYSGRTTAALAAALLISSVIATDSLAQKRDRGGQSPETREFIQSLSREERQEYRSMSRRERRAFIRERMPRRSKGDAERKAVPETDGVEKTTADAAPPVEGLEGFIPPGEIAAEIRMMVGKGRKRTRNKAVDIQRARGAIETGLEPDFMGGADCPEIDSEKWAIDYSHKRRWKAIHKGIDIPQPRGTPVRAVADGMVIGKFQNERNRKGIEVTLRHTPAQTGLPYWTYSQYTHLLEMSPLPLGAKVKMGQEIGKTSNTGKMGRRIRRDALHFSILYSKRPEWSNDGDVVTPKDSYWMDPNAFYRVTPPYDSQSLVKLPADQKKIPVPYMKPNGSFVQPDTKRIWPYTCG